MLTRAASIGVAILLLSCGSDSVTAPTESTMEGRKFFTGVDRRIGSVSFTTKMEISFSASTYSWSEIQDALGDVPDTVFVERGEYRTKESELFLRRLSGRFYSARTGTMQQFTPHIYEPLAFIDWGSSIKIGSREYESY